MTAQHVPFTEQEVVTQVFGATHPRYTALRLAGHNGVDFALPLGTEVLSVEDAECWEVEYDPAGFGYYVKTRTEAGAEWLYAHLQMWELPRPGTWLPAGAHIGWSGSTGMSTGPHLHLGWRPRWWERGGGYVGYADPLPQLQTLFATS